MRLLPIISIASAAFSDEKAGSVILTLTGISSYDLTFDHNINPGELCSSIAPGYRTYDSKLIDDDLYYLYIPNNNDSTLIAQEIEYQGVAAYNITFGSNSNDSNLLFNFSDSKNIIPVVNGTTMDYYYNIHPSAENDCLQLLLSPYLIPAPFQIGELKSKN